MEFPQSLAELQITVMLMMFFLQHVLSRLVSVSRQVLFVLFHSLHLYTIFVFIPVPLFLFFITITIISLFYHTISGFPERIMLIRIYIFNFLTPQYFANIFIHWRDDFCKC